MGWEFLLVQSTWKRTELIKCYWECLESRLRTTLESFHAQMRISDSYSWQWCWVQNLRKNRYLSGFSRHTRVCMAFLSLVYHVVLIGRELKGYLSILFNQERSKRRDVFSGILSCQAENNSKGVKTSLPLLVDNAFQISSLKMYCGPSHVTYTFHTSRWRYSQIYLLTLAQTQRKKIGKLGLFLYTD